MIANQYQGSPGCRPKVDLEQVARGRAAHHEVTELLDGGEAGRVVDEGNVDAALVCAVVVGHIVDASRPGDRIRQQPDDMGVLDLADAEDIRPLPAVDLADDRAQLVNLPV